MYSKFTGPLQKSQFLFLPTLRNFDRGCSNRNLTPLPIKCMQPKPENTKHWEINIDLNKEINHKLTKLRNFGSRQFSFSLDFRFLSCPKQLNRWPCRSLDHSISQGTLQIDIHRATPETCELWNIGSERWGVITWQFPRKKDFLREKNGFPRKE